MPIKSYSDYNYVLLKENLNKKTFMLSLGFEPRNLSVKAFKAFVYANSTMRAFEFLSGMCFLSGECYNFLCAPLDVNITNVLKWLSPMPLKRSILTYNALKSSPLFGYVSSEKINSGKG